MEKQYITKFQFFAIIFSYITANDLIRGFYAIDLSFDLWIPITSSIFLSVSVFFIYSFIYKNNNYNNFKESIENITGKFISKIIFILYALYFLVLVYLNLSDIVELVIRFFMPKAIGFFVGLGFIIVILYVIKKGIEPFSKYNTFIFFATLLTLIVFSSILFTSNKFTFSNVLPILEYGVRPLIIPTLEMTYGVPMGELFVILMIFQFMKNSDKKKGYRKGYYGILVSGALLLLVTMLNIFVLNPEALSLGINPSMRVWRLIDNDEFIQRFDLIVLCFLMAFSMTKLVIMTFGTKHMINNVISIKRKQIIYILIGLVLFIAKFFFGKNYLEFFEFRIKYFIPYVNLFFEIVIPFLLVIISFFRKKKAKPNPNLEENKTQIPLDVSGENLEF